MINANVIKGVQELLGEHGAEAGPHELLGDHVARALHISSGQAEVFLEALHDGASTEDAVAKAKIDPTAIDHGLLTGIAQRIGTLLAEVSKRS